MNPLRFLAAPASLLLVAVPVAVAEATPADVHGGADANVSVPMPELSPAETAAGAAAAGRAAIDRGRVTLTARRDAAVARSNAARDHAQDRASVAGAAATKALPAPPAAPSPSSTEPGAPGSQCPLPTSSPVPAASAPTSAQASLDVRIGG